MSEFKVKASGPRPLRAAKCSQAKARTTYLQTTKHHFLPSGFFHTVLPAADHNGVKSLFEVAMKLGYLTIGKVIEI